MPLLQPTPTRPDPVLARTLWQLFALGLLAMLVVPALRGPVYQLGNMPFWLAVAPGIALATLYRHALVAAWRARLVRATPRRRQRSGARPPLQARGLQARRTSQRKGAVAPSLRWPGKFVL